MSAPRPPACSHCGLPIPPGVVIVSEHQGEGRRFCCHGCHGAWSIINAAGLERFYRQRDWQEPGLPAGAYAAAYDDQFLARYVEHTGPAAELSFVIEGIRCASCVWLIEKIITGLEGVESARVNYATHRARIRYAPQLTSPARLFETVTRLGYLPRPFTSDNAHRARERERRSLLMRLGAALFLSMQLMGYSLALYAGYFQGMESADKRLLQFLAALVATPVVFYCGWPFLAGAWRGLRHRAAGMDLLVASGVLAAWGASVHALWAGGEVYFDTAAMIVTLLLTGRLFENGARRRAASGVDRLLQLAPDNTLRLDADGHPVTVAASALQPGDQILVRPGERIPADGRVAMGCSEIDCAAATGEPLPQPKEPGDEVLAGTLNLVAALTVTITRTAGESFIARVARLVEEAQARRAPVQRLAEVTAAWFVPLVALLAAATWLYWTFEPGPEPPALLTAIAVLVIACPCALGLATPTAILVAAGQAARSGILFRGGDILEATSRIDTVVFDKTGTLTAGQPRLTAIEPHGISAEELLLLAVAIEQGSTHPLAAGVLAEAANRGLYRAPLPEVQTLPGLGLRGASGGTTLLAGSRRLLGAAGIDVPPGSESERSEIHIASDTSYLGCLRFADPLRAGAADVVRELHRRGLRTLLLSGDNPAAAQAVASALGIGEARGNLSPEEKCARLQELLDSGRRVLMVGDGINDAPALSLADVGCAMAGGTDIALATSDLVLTRAELPRLLEALDLARRTMTIIRQNLFWAFAYNVAAIPLAALGLLAPIHAAAAMTLSSLCVVGNSLRLGAGPGKDRPAHE